MPHILKQNLVDIFIERGFIKIAPSPNKNTWFDGKLDNLNYNIVIKTPWKWNLRAACLQNDIFKDVVALSAAAIDKSESKFDYIVPVTKAGEKLAAAVAAELGKEFVNFMKPGAKWTENSSVLPVDYETKSISHFMDDILNNVLHKTTNYYNERMVRVDSSFVVLDKRIKPHCAFFRFCALSHPEAVELIDPSHPMKEVIAEYVKEECR